MSGWGGVARTGSLAVSLAVVLVMCGGLSAPKPTPKRPDKAQCDMALPAHYIGAKADPQVRRVIAAIGRRHQPIRWIMPGRTITTDYNAGRLNVILNDKGRIVAMRCG